jgi:hypothetical protein
MGWYSDKSGFCTKDPVWIAVDAKHYCHHLKMEDPALPGIWRESLDMRREGREKLYVEYKKAVEMKKHYRRKYLEAKAKLEGKP